jgi:ABC-type multidrug transport system fused ATPase/permease subunit
MGLPFVLDIVKGFIKEHPWMVSLNLAFLFTYPLQDIILPHFYGKVMEDVSKGKSPDNYLVTIVCLLVFIQLVSLVADYHNAKLFPALENYVRSVLLKRIFDMYQEEYKELETGYVIVKMTKIPALLGSWLDKLKNTIMPYFLVYFFAIIYFFMIDPQIALSLMITIGIVVFVALRSPLVCEKPSIARDKRYHDIQRQVDDVLNNLFAVFGARQQDAEIKRLNDFAKVYVEHYKNTMKCAIGQMVCTIPFIIAFIIFFVARCSSLVSDGKLESSKFISMFIIFLYILNTLTILNDQLKDIIFDWGVIQGATEDLFDDTIKTRRKKRKVSEPCPQHIPDKGVVFDNVTFQYPKTSRTILDGVSLHIQKGERVCFVGDIGSGKSTILKLILKYYSPTNGNIYYDGTPYSAIDIAKLRSKVGYVPQQSILFNRSILDNILYGNKVHNREDVLSAVKVFNLDNEFSKFEKGLDTNVGKNGTNLSGGQRQLVWCLRVLLQNPEVVVLDEPTASIDDKTKEVLHNMLDTIMKNKTVLMVTHDPFLVKISTRIVKLEKGKVADEK